MDLKTGKPVAEEALARLIDESGNIIVAADFILAAMELQLTHLIDYQIGMNAKNELISLGFGSIYKNDFLFGF